VVQKSYPSITRVFPALGVPSRSHGESLLPLNAGLLPRGSAGLEWEAVVRAGPCPTRAVLLQLSRGCKLSPKVVPGRWELR